MSTNLFKINQFHNLEELLIASVWVTERVLFLSNIILRSWYTFFVKSSLLATSWHRSKSLIFPRRQWYPQLPSSMFSSTHPKTTFNSAAQLKLLKTTSKVFNQNMRSRLSIVVLKTLCLPFFISLSTKMACMFVVLLSGYCHHCIIVSQHVRNINIFSPCCPRCSMSPPSLPPLYVKTVECFITFFANMNSCRSSCTVFFGNKTNHFCAGIWWDFGTRRTCKGSSRASLFVTRPVNSCCLGTTISTVSSSVSNEERHLSYIDFLEKSKVGVKIAGTSLEQCKRNNGRQSGRCYVIQNTSYVKTIKEMNKHKGNTDRTVCLWKPSKSYKFHYFVDRLSEKTNQLR